MKIYTRRGDDGSTGLFGGGRVPKHDARVEAYGTIDELNAVLGRALLSVEDEAAGNRLGLVQRDLFSIGAVLATPREESEERHPHVPEVPAFRVEEMERWIDEATDRVEPLKQFVLPGGAEGAADLHIARTICRRAERRVVALAETEEVDGAILRYLNRLSDLLFAFARMENRKAGTDDVVWQKPERPSG